MERDIDLELNTTNIDVNLGQNVIEIDLHGGTRGLQGIQGPPGPIGPGGSTGPAGRDGIDGQDGFSPTITSSKSGKTTTLTITDVNGTTTTTILDGEDGSCGNAKTYYGTCNTNTTTQTKVVVSDGFVLETGATINVKFKYACEYGGSGYTTQNFLNVNNTGAKTITTLGGINSCYYWQGGETITFVYDGTGYRMVRSGNATTSFYGLTKLSSSTSSTSTSLAATPSAVKTAYDLANGKQDALVSGTNIKTINNASLLGSGDISLEVPTNKVTTLDASSTDTQYPSAKCVYDIIGDIETILTTLDIGNGV